MAKPRVPKKSTSGNGATTAEVTSTTMSASNGNGTAIEAEAPKPATRKAAAIKADSRPNLVPINLEDEIRRLAYLMSERRGFEPGHEAEDWIAAEREVLQRYQPQSA